MPLDPIESLHADSRAFLARARAGQPCRFDEAHAFIARLRSHASVPELARRFEADANFEPGAFKQEVIATEAQVEKLMARAYIAGHADCIEPEMQDGLAMARKEAGALGLEAGTGGWLHFVGCGAAPLTVMRYHDLCGARVVCIDRDGEALDLARQMLVRRYGAASVARHFGFVHAEAASLQLPPRSVRHLLLAAHCRHKEALMRDLAPALAEGCRVLVRLPMGLYHHVYDSVDFRLCPGYTELLQVDDAAEPFCRAALLRFNRGEA